MNWSPEQRAFMMWSVTPKRIRSPKTQSELADMLGVHEKTLSRWAALPGWLEAKNNMVMRRLIGKLPLIVNAWIEDLTGDSDMWQARRDFFRYAMPYLAQLQNTEEYKEVNESAIGALPASTIEDDIAGLPGPERARLLGILEKIGAIQSGSALSDVAGSALLDATLLPDFEVEAVELPAGTIDAAVSGVRPSKKVASSKRRVPGSKRSSKSVW